MHREAPWLDGIPLRLPALLDRVAEGWWRLAPRRQRSLIGIVLLAATTVVLARVALSPYGPPITVVVARSDLELGHRLTAADLATTRWPRSLIPAAALPDPEAAIGRTLAIATTASGVLTDRHVRPTGVSAQVALGAAALPVRSALLPGVTVGARIDLIIRLGDGSGRTAAQGVLVLALEDGLLWLEVPRAAAADLAAAAGRDALFAVLLPG